MRRFEALAKELKDTQDSAINKQNDLERKLRIAQEDTRSLKEDLEDSQSQLSSIDRQHKHQLQEIESKHATFQKTISGLRDDLATESNARKTAQGSLSAREAEVGHLENEVLRLKAQTGDAETIAIIKKDLSDQVAHIRRLETLNREQNAELKRLRMSHRAVEVVEEQKKELQNKLTLMEDLRSDLREAQLQRQILEDERSSWTSYLLDQVNADDAGLKTPEDLARALVRQRLETANMMEKIGALKSEILDRDQTIGALEAQSMSTMKEMERLKSTSSLHGVDSSTKKRLERQRALAVKEVEFLREQLRTFDTEETTFQPEVKFDEQRSKRIQELETLVDDYRAELSTLNSTLSVLEEKSPALPSSDIAAPPASRKRPHEEEEDDTSNKFGNLSRKNRKLQDDLSALQGAHSVLSAEHNATVTQLRALQQSSKTRILALKSNPTSNHEAIKLSTLTSLEAENKALLARLDASSATTVAKSGTIGEDTVPKQTLERFHREADALRAEIADKSKRELRLKQIWSLKSLEFREAVASLLGWKMNFLPNGRFSLTSIFYEGLNPSSSSGDEGEANAIIFDGDTGTMKISGGPDGAFGKEIRGSIDYWVKGRNEIPCFMAALTMEFYERTTRAARA